MARSKNPKVGVYLYSREGAPVYVGCSIDLHRRRGQHKNSGRFLDCDYSVLEETTTEELYERERFWIRKLGTFESGENKVIHNNQDLPEVREAQAKRMREDNPMKPGMTNSGSFQKGVARPEIYTPERNAKISKSMSGKNNPNYGNPDAAKQMHVRLTCPVCGATMNIGNYRRWGHGPECSRKSSS